MMQVSECGGGWGGGRTPKCPLLWTPKHKGALFRPLVTDDGFKSVWPMKWVISITLPQSEFIISTTSERYRAPLCLELNTKVDIKGEKGKP